MRETETRERYHFRQLGKRLETLRECDGLPSFSNGDGFISEHGSESLAASKDAASTQPAFYFSEEDYKRVIQESFESGVQKGLEQGKLEAQAYYDQQHKDEIQDLQKVFSAITLHLKDSQHKMNEIASEQIASLVPLTLTIAEKLSGVMLQGKEHEKLCQEIRKCLQFVADEPTIRLGVSSEIFSAMEDILSVLGKDGAHIKSVYADPQLSALEFRLEYEGGKVETHSPKTHEAIHNLLSSFANTQIK